MSSGISKLRNDFCHCPGECGDKQYKLLFKWKKPFFTAGEVSSRRQRFVESETAHEIVSNLGKDRLERRFLFENLSLMVLGGLPLTGPSTYTFNSYVNKNGSFDIVNNYRAGGMTIFFKGHDKKTAVCVSATFNGSKLPDSFLDLEEKLKTAKEVHGSHTFFGGPGMDFKADGAALDQAINDARHQRSELQKAAQKNNWNLRYPVKQSQDVVAGFIKTINQIQVDNVPGPQAREFINGEVRKAFQSNRRTFFSIDWRLIMTDSPYKLSSQTTRRLHGIFQTPLIVQALGCRILFTNSHTLATSMGEIKVRTNKKSNRSLGFKQQIIDSDVNQDLMFDGHHKLWEKFQSVEMESAVLVQTAQVRKEEFIKNEITNYGVDHLYWRAIQDPHVPEVIKNAAVNQGIIKRGQKRGLKFTTILP